LPGISENPQTNRSLKTLVTPSVGNAFVKKLYFKINFSLVAIYRSPDWGNKKNLF
jgi:hypothetical protein